MANNKELNPRHQAFIRHYLRYGSKTFAYHSVYPNCSDSTAHSQSTKLLRRADIRAELEPIQRLILADQVKLIRDIEREMQLEFRVSIFDVVKFNKKGEIKLKKHNWWEMTPQIERSLLRVKLHYRRGKLVGASIPGDRKIKAMDWLLKLYSGKLYSRWMKRSYKLLTGGKKMTNHITAWKRSKEMPTIDIAKNPGSARVLLFEYSQWKKCQNDQDHPMAA